MIAAVGQRELERQLGATAPADSLTDAPVSRVAILGEDYQDLHHTLVVQPGDTVRLGDTLFVNRKFPDVRYAAPASGRVVAINLGRQRMLQSLVIDVDDDRPVAIDAAMQLAPAQIRKHLLATGLWPALRSRPFNRTPDPRSVPSAIYVVATDTRPLCPDPAPIIAANPHQFSKGVQVLARLCSRTRVCVDRDIPLQLTTDPDVEIIRHGGAHPMGLAGTFIHRHEPGLAVGREVWHIGYQDVMRIGRLWLTGHLDFGQTISIAGPAVEPRLVRTCVGASTEDLLGQLQGPEARVLSGSVLDGRVVGPLTAYLGRFHHQVTVLHAEPSRVDGAIGSVWRRLFGTRSPTAQPWGVMLPLERFERIWALDVPPLVLLRALLTGDADTAVALGCLALDEEDLALCSYVCPGWRNYGAALRGMLRDIERSA